MAVFLTTYYKLAFQDNVSRKPSVVVCALIFCLPCMTRRLIAVLHLLEIVSNVHASRCAEKIFQVDNDNTLIIQDIVSSMWTEKIYGASAMFFNIYFF